MNTDIKPKIKQEKTEGTEIKERPILFSGEMVRAIMGGRKTQTRRVVKLPKSKGLEYRWDGVVKDGGAESLFKSGEYLHVPFRCLADGENEWEQGTMERVFCPYGNVGDRLWVKETFKLRNARIAECGLKNCIYAADQYAEGMGIAGPWKPSIFMPRWASRITLEITGIRVERLQEISEEDARAEGAQIGSLITHGYDNGTRPTEFIHAATCREAYFEIWESINGEGSWEKNPWVWVIGFKRLGN